MKREIRRTEIICDICDRELWQESFFSIKGKFTNTTGSMGIFEAFVKPEKIDICGDCAEEIKKIVTNNKQT